MKVQYSLLSNNCLFIKEKDNFALVTYNESIIFSNDPNFISFFQVQDDNIIQYSKEKFTNYKFQSKLAIYIGSYLEKEYIYLPEFELLINFQHSNEELLFLIQKLNVKKILLFSKNIFIFPASVLISSLIGNE